MKLLRIHPETNLRQLAMVANRIICALFISVIVGCASTRQHEGTGEYVDDSVITGKVKASVFNDPALKSAEINVETFKGAVQLSGFVESQADIDKAVILARRVQGVTNVKNSMHVKGTQ